MSHRFSLRPRDYHCLHCKRNFINATRKGMYDHAQLVDINEIKNVIIEQKIFADSKAIDRLSNYTLWNLLTDLSGVVYQ